LKTTQPTMAKFLQRGRSGIVLANEW